MVARAYRRELTESLRALLGHDGVLMMPTMPDVAPLISQDAGSLEDYRNRAIRMLSISGMSGFPQISLPMAHRLGVPLGFSLLGPAGSDRSLIRISQQLMSR
jgi:amidase